jgi:hypothetical protein
VLSLDLCRCTHDLGWLNNQPRLKGAPVGHQHVFFSEVDYVTIVTLRRLTLSGSIAKRPEWRALLGGVHHMRGELVARTLHPSVPGMRRWRPRDCMPALRRPLWSKVAARGSRFQ